MRKIAFYSGLCRLAVALLLLVAMPRLAFCATTPYVKTGEIARDFTLKNRKTGQPVSLSDFSGKIILLDMFAYW